MRTEIREMEQYLNLQRFERAPDGLTDEEWRHSLSDMSIVPSRIRTQMEKNHLSFLDVVKKFNAAKRQNNAARQVKSETQRVRRAHAGGFGDAGAYEELPEEPEDDDTEFKERVSAYDHNVAMQQAELDVVDAGLDTHEALVEEHVEGIKTIEQDMVEISTIMKDMAEQVMAQGEVVDDIHDNVVDADQLVEDALENLIVANKSGKKGAKLIMLTMCIMFCVIIVIFIIIVKVILSTILKVYMAKG